MVQEFPAVLFLGSILPQQRDHAVRTTCSCRHQNLNRPLTAGVTRTIVCVQVRIPPHVTKDDDNEHNHNMLKSLGRINRTKPLLVTALVCMVSTWHMCHAC